MRRLLPGYSVNCILSRWIWSTWFKDKIFLNFVQKFICSAGPKAHSWPSASVPVRSPWGSLLSGFILFHQFVLDTIVCLLQSSCRVCRLFFTVLQLSVTPPSPCYCLPAYSLLLLGRQPSSILSVTVRLCRSLFFSSLIRFLNDTERLATN